MSSSFAACSSVRRDLFKFYGHALHRCARKTVDVIDRDKAIEAAGNSDIDECVAASFFERVLNSFGK